MYSSIINSIRPQPNRSSFDILYETTLIHHRDDLQEKHLFKNSTYVGRSVKIVSYIATLLIYYSLLHLKGVKYTLFELDDKLGVAQDKLSVYSKKIRSFLIKIPLYKDLGKSHLILKTKEDRDLQHLFEINSANLLKIQNINLRETFRAFLNDILMTIIQKIYLLIQNFMRLCCP